MLSKLPPNGRTFQQPRVEGHDADNLHPVLRQDDPEAQQEEGHVLIDACTDDVQRGDHGNDQQQRRLVGKRNSKPKHRGGNQSDWLQSYVVDSQEGHERRYS